MRKIMWCEEPPEEPGPTAPAGEHAAAAGASGAAAAACLAVAAGHRREAHRAPHTSAARRRTPGATVAGRREYLGPGHGEPAWSRRAQRRSMRSGRRTTGPTGRPPATGRVLLP